MRGQLGCAWPVLGVCGANRISTRAVFRSGRHNARTRTFARTPTSVGRRISRGMPSRIPHDHSPRNCLCRGHAGLRGARADRSARRRHEGIGAHRAHVSAKPCGAARHRRAQLGRSRRRAGGRPRAPPLRPSRIHRRRAHAGPRAAGREIGGGVTHFWRVANAPRGGARHHRTGKRSGKSRGCRSSWDSPGSPAGWPDEAPSRRLAARRRLRPTTAPLGFACESPGERPLDAIWSGRYAQPSARKENRRCEG